jgi:fused signal recognition particle receptor
MEIGLSLEHNSILIGMFFLGLLGGVSLVIFLRSRKGVLLRKEAHRLDQATTTTDVTSTTATTATTATMATMVTATTGASTTATNFAAMTNLTADLAVDFINDPATNLTTNPTTVVDRNQKDFQKEEKPRVSLISESLKSTRSHFWGRLEEIFLGNRDHKDRLEQIEEILYLSDLGPKVVAHFLKEIESLDHHHKNSIESLKSFIQQEAFRILNQVQPSLDLQNFNLESLRNLSQGLETQKNPYVFLIVGVNGAGKTTTIGKLASQACQKGLKVLVVAGDTFRAAAQEQLSEWAERAQVEVFAPENIKDPGAVAFESIKKAQISGLDLVLIDTAGRLHTSHNLMEELKKVHKVIQKALPGAPHEVLLVLDASGGQNAVIQAEQFHHTVPVTGLILTKLDGTAKGGMVLNAVDKIKKPIVWVGVGEKAQDLVAFKAEDFSAALVSNNHKP